MKDITYCSATDCTNRKCERHATNLKGMPKDETVSVADFAGVCRYYIGQIVERMKEGRE